MSKLHFHKMHGAGNDFILLDGRSVNISSNISSLVQFLCDRRTGVGADGLMILLEDDSCDFRLCYFNADGSEGEMCGNGARCAAALAHRLGMAPAKMRFVILSEEYAATIEVDGQVRIGMPSVVILKQPTELQHLLRANQRAMLLLEVGVPHLVVEVEGDLAKIDVAVIGRELRYHSTFAPRGCNVNFVQLAPSGNVLIRTYERGVEEETRACGTGAVAASFYYQQQGVALPLNVLPPGGELQIHAAEPGCDLVGPVAFVFEGRMDLPADMCS
ncbi:MAG: diaminopimelate epimerase [Calditrichia bacterium]